MGHVTVPRIIHWWWDGPAVPPKYVRYRERWAELHPDWNLMVWDEEMFRLNFEHHPAAGIYFERDRWSPRAHEWGWKTNIARLLILQRLGGLWVDADLEPLRAVDPLIQEAGDRAVAAREDRTHVNNAFLASPALDGQFIDALIQGLPARVRSRRHRPSNVATGPHYLTEVAARNPETITVLDRELIYPMHWSELDRRGEDFPDAYTLHHWHRKTTEAAGRRRPVPGPAWAGPRAPRGKDLIVNAPPPRLRKLPGLTPEPVALALADLAAQVPANRAIVELGVYQGKTLLYLAWGARQGRAAKVWGIDPWDLPGERGPYTQNPEGALGRHRKAFTDPGTRAWARYNVKALGYANQVRLIRGFSAPEGQRWSGPGVGLLFVDGDHRYDAVRADLTAWAPHLTDDAVVAFDDYASTHPEVIQAVDDMVAEGILEPVEIFHDRLAVTRLGSGHPELVRREQDQTRVVEDAKMTAVTSEGAAVQVEREHLDQLPEVEAAERAREELANAIWPGVRPEVPRGGIQFPLPEAVEGDSTEHEHPGTGESMEAIEDTPEGTEQTLTAGLAWALEPPASGRPVEPAGKAETVPMAAAGPAELAGLAGKGGVDPDPNVAISRETVLPSELDSVTTQTTLEELNVAQLRELAKVRGVTLGRDRKTRDAALAALRSGK